MSGIGLADRNKDRGAGAAKEEIRKVSEAAGSLDKGKSKQSVGEFVQKTREEMGRTTFPSADDVRKTTMIVVINVLFFAVFLFVIDRFWVYILEGLTWVVNRLAAL